MEIDVTDKMMFGLNDGGGLPIYKCICEQEFKPWEFPIFITSDNPNYLDFSECPSCGRRFAFKTEITILEYTEDK
jgi:hypothetical protein